jgi:hypothetical protein
MLSTLKSCAEVSTDFALSTIRKKSEIKNERTR